MNRLPGLHPDTGARRTRLRRVALALAGASMILVACGTGSGDDVPEDRQFANDPAPTREATELPAQAPTQPVSNAPEQPAAATPADLLSTRGAPSTLYTVSGDRLVVLHMDDPIDQSTVELPPGNTVIGLGASPTGDRVGIVTATDGDGLNQVFFYNANGEMIGGPYAVTPGFPAGTPFASPVASPGATPVGTPGATPALVGFGPVSSVSWTPQGNGVLLASGEVLVYVDVERGAEVIPTDDIPGTILGAEASPTGGQILVHATGEDDSHRAYLVQIDTGRVDELWALRTDPGAGLAELRWLPTGKGVVFVRGELIEDRVMRGQLFSYEFRNDSPRLVATSGQGGPSATIRNVEVSPNGRSAAYTVAILDVDTWSLHSMWVRSLKGEDAQGLQLPVDSGHTVNQLAWSSEGLVWSYTARYGDEGDFVGLVTPDGDFQAVMPIGVTAATPGASPVTSASPIASPMATPVGSPVATPSGPGV